VRRLAVAAALLLGAATSRVAAQRTRNVVLVVTDGLRWQDVFTGADSTIVFGDARYLGDTAAVRRDFWRPDAVSRRRAMMPWLWSVVARDGQIFTGRVTNGLKFSYPGYNEMLSGAADPRIRSNSYGPNPDTTVFEWLARKPAFAGKVAAFGTWAAFTDIFNAKRAGPAMHVQAGWEPPIAAPSTREDSLLDRLYATTFRQWDDNAYDAFMQASLLRYLRDHRPRVLFVGYGETDEWAHSGRYDRVLRSARAVDSFIAELWTRLQSLPEYRGTTTLIVTTDHGRGSVGTTWRDHGEKVDGAEDIWMAVLGPDTPPRGERMSFGAVTQSQIAGTIAALLGQRFGAAAPIAEVIKR
jgi:hypothetical protein